MLTSSSWFSVLPRTESCFRRGRLCISLKKSVPSRQPWPLTVLQALMLPIVSETVHEYFGRFLKNRRNASVSASTSTFLAMMTKTFRLHLLLDSVGEENKRCLALLTGFSFPFRAST